MSLLARVTRRSRQPLAELQDAPTSRVDPAPGVRVQGPLFDLVSHLLYVSRFLGAAFTESVPAGSQHELVLVLGPDVGNQVVCLDPLGHVGPFNDAKCTLALRVVYILEILALARGECLDPGWR